MDGAVLNTRIQDKSSSTWRENKLGVSFASINIIKRGNSEKSGKTIRKKEYTAYIGSSDEFAKKIEAIWYALVTIHCSTHTIFKSKG